MSAPDGRSLVIVRHGRTAHNAKGLLLGRTDAPLDELGRRQADAAAAALISGRFGEIVAVVSSPLLRAVQTAEALGLPVSTDDRLIELDYGSYEGTPVVDLPPATWARWQSDLDFAPPGGESLADLGRRVREACTEMGTGPGSSGTVVVVSHVSPIKAAMAWALGVGDEVSWRSHVDNASLTTVQMRGDRPVLSLFNATDHLRGVTSDG